MIKLLENLSHTRKTINSWKLQDKKIGLVPTMGNLHSGHLSLIEHLKNNGAQKIIVSIFVNPKQFGPNEDFKEYPRTLDADLKKLKETYIDCVFVPNESAIYPDQETGELNIENRYLMSILCAENRPSHFQGVLLIVNKLFNIIQPDITIFGQKDYQQYIIIKNMVENLFIPTKLLLAPIYRETDGLAMSSRNSYLQKKDREVSPLIYKTLSNIRSEIINKSSNPNNLIPNYIKILEKEGFVVEYLEIRDKNNLRKPKDFSYQKNKYILLIAARIGKTRLIDNIII
tara:strand:+ start:2523 stop:3380 length:858 start_codon:yes stop_codon:yes gene_type:complete